jgi:hypothetical protein
MLPRTGPDLFSLTVPTDQLEKGRWRLAPRAMDARGRIDIGAAVEFDVR